MTAAVQTIWAELLAATLADAGVTTCVISPGSRSTPLVAALAGETRLELVTIIDERAAAFFALGVARATGTPAAIVCTSGTAAAHYLPAIVEAHMASVPLIAITADRPPELQACGASQTIDQVGMYGGFVREAFDLGAPVAHASALRGMRRKLVQAITAARGPHPGPVHVEVPLRKPLEPAPPATDEDRALARIATELRGRVRIAPPVLAPDDGMIAALAQAVTAEPDGVIVAGALPAGFAAHRERVFELAERTGYPVVAEAGSQLRFGPRPASVVLLDHLDAVPVSSRPTARLVLQLGGDPVAASWPAWLATLPQRWVLAGAAWNDPDSSARGVVLGDVARAIDALVARLATASRASGRIRTTAWLDTWRDVERRARGALDAAIAQHAHNEVAVVRAAVDAVPDGGLVQVGNSLPIRTIDHAAAAGAARLVLTQRGAAGIDGLIASAAGATRLGAPVLLVLGDVSFAHDLAEVSAAVAAALAQPGPTIIHAPSTASGAHDVRRTAIELYAGDRR